MVNDDTTFMSLDLLWSDPATKKEEVETLGNDPSSVNQPPPGSNPSIVLPFFVTTGICFSTQHLCSITLLPREILFCFLLPCSLVSSCHQPDPHLLFLSFSSISKNLGLCSAFPLSASQSPKN